MALTEKSYWYDRRDTPAPWGKGSGKKPGRKHGKRSPVRRLATGPVKAFAKAHDLNKARGRWVALTPAAEKWIADIMAARKAREAEKAAS